MKIIKMNKNLFLCKIIDVILTIMSVAAYFITLPAWTTAACIALKVVNRCLKWYVRRRLPKSKQTVGNPSDTPESAIK